MRALRDASGRPSRVAERRAQVIAGALAPAALLGGQTAVLMVMRVTLALGGAGATRGQACRKRRELRVRVRGGERLWRTASAHAWDPRPRSCYEPIRSGDRQSE